MQERLMNFGFKENEDSIIKVVGVGGAGCNAVNHMHKEGINGVNFVVCNTDIQALQISPINLKIPLGITLTEGRGAGNNPLQGEQAAIENIEDIRLVFENSTKMIFLAAGMGGGTGTGATPVIARLAQEMGILTVAVVTIPSPHEGQKRYSQALQGVEQLKPLVDSLLVVSNEKLMRLYGNLPARIAFGKADEIISNAVKGCAEIITLPGAVNIDFADVESTMKQSGLFLMGSGLGSGEDRASMAVYSALKSPLLDSNDIMGAKNILLNIISSSNHEARLNEIGQIIDTVQDEAGDSAEIIWGTGVNESLGDQLFVTVLATGFYKNPNQELSGYVQQINIHNYNNSSKQTENQVHLSESPFQKSFSKQEEEVEHVMLHTENEEEPVDTSSMNGFNEAPQDTISQEPHKKKEKKETEAPKEKVIGWFKQKFGLNNLFEE
ncbi:cell division protein FtsZ [Halosquirtibacter laminarini]|uniref:Cell division protein FtsZ n=1 Tax=Halosquirtibacter laminarini TaxID=3374600 RepID=A0AC61NGH6_9BACT|nr:cell division protein FtsZ [Prolixibacteraceae bacterium]